MAFEWFISFIVFLIIEALTVNLVTIWFAVGALAAIISCLFTDSIIIQAVVFVIVSVYFLRNLLFESFVKLLLLQLILIELLVRLVWLQKKLV